MTAAPAGGVRLGSRALEGRFVIGPYGIIEDANADVTPLLGYAREEVVGEHGSMLVPRELRPATAASLDRMRRGEISFSVGRLLRRDGTEVDVEVYHRPLPDDRMLLLVRARLADDPSDG